MIGAHITGIVRIGAADENIAIIRGLLDAETLVTITASQHLLPLENTGRVQFNYPHVFCTMATTDVGGYTPAHNIPAIVRWPGAPVPPGFVVPASFQPGIPV
jgi:hypothetical protein